MRLNVIPYPQVVEFVGPELYQLPRSPAVYVDNEALLAKAVYLQQALQQHHSTYATLQVSSNKQHDSGQSEVAIKLSLQQDRQQLQQGIRWSQEAYELTCDSTGIQITAITSTGIFYGVQSLLQALRSTSAGWAMPHTRVSYSPCPRVVLV